MKNYRVGQAAELIGVSASTLRRYTEEGRIAEARNPAGQRIYTQTSIDAFMGKPTLERKTVFYVRSSDNDNIKIDNQIALLTKAYGEPSRVYKDKASGLNEKRSGLQSLILNAGKHNYTTIAVTQKDRLTRFGFTYLEQLFSTYNVEVVVLGEETTKTLHEELLQDFMSLVASFSGKFYRLRGYEQQQQLITKAGEVIAEKKRTS